MNSQPDEMLVIGYGNPLRGDDAIGYRVAQRSAGLGYSAIATVQLLPEISERIASAKLVVFVDCDLRLAPGQVAVSEPAPGQTLHGATSPAALLELARVLFGNRPAAFSIGIGPASMELCESLSAEVERAIPAVLEHLRRLAEHQSS